MALTNNQRNVLEKVTQSRIQVVEAQMDAWLSGDVGSLNMLEKIDRDLSEFLVTFREKNNLCGTCGVDLEGSHVQGTSTCTTVSKG